MTNIDLKQFLNFWKDRNINLPDPQHYPVTFQWYVKLYQYYSSKKRIVEINS